MLNHFYYPHKLAPGERKYHSFELAVNFSRYFDPYYVFHSDFFYDYNDCKVRDPELDEIMVKLRRVHQGEKEEYSRYWLEFQQRWQEILPIFPLYSLKYRYVYNKELQGFLNTPFTSWAESICDIHK